MESLVVGISPKVQLALEPYPKEEKERRESLRLDIVFIPRREVRSSSSRALEYFPFSGVKRSSSERYVFWALFSSDHVMQRRKVKLRRFPRLNLLTVCCFNIDCF